MAQNKYAKAQKLSKREHDKVQALKEDYLQTVYKCHILQPNYQMIYMLLAQP